MKKKLHERAALIRAVRFFFENSGYLEVETPVCNPVLIPETNIEPVIAAELFLHTSPELCMKRLLAKGYEKIFQICKCFRSRERGGRHLPEFTMLEWYCVQGDYQSLMAETVELLQFVAMKMQGVGGMAESAVVLLQQEPQFLTVHDAFKMYTDITVEQAIAGNCFEEHLVDLIEPHLGVQQPCFLYDYPVSLGSLARTKKADPTLAERFELYLNGVEVANGFSELTDPVEQRQRFETELEQAKQAGHFRQMPERFLDDLEMMPESCGIALGLDRLVMILTGAVTIDEVVSFTLEEL
jgi:lysyl-tRNA synthetase class 2